MSSTSITCRVCGEHAEYLFNKLILNRHQVEYFRCMSCGHVQTEEPFWLEEAYREPNFRRDTGLVDRCLWTAQTTVALAHRLRIGPHEVCVDWGGGTGLFTRICRDHGMNFYYQDRYATNVFARGFEFPEDSPSSNVVLLTAFEVMEHLPNPATDIRDLLQLRPQYLLFSTLLYRGEDPSWWYFLDNGQHVAFFTRRSLGLIAAQNGYHLLTDNRDLHIFARQRFRQGILGSCRQHRERLSARYRKRHGSRIWSDFELLGRALKMPGEDHPA